MATDWEREVEGLTRRNAIGRGFAAAGALALVCSFDHLPEKHPTVRYVRGRARSAQASSGLFDPFQVDLPISPVLRPVASTPKLDQYVVTMKPGTANILKGLPTPILGYNGIFPGPTVRATRGRKVEVRQINSSGRPLNVHLHGGVTEQNSDGYPLESIPNNDERTYHYASAQRGATLWYHDHSHGDTAVTLFAGLAAFHIIRDPNEDQFDLPQGDYDVPIMLQDRAFNADGSFRYRVNVDLGFRGDTLLVNGAIAPRMRVERRLYRFRILNSSNARPYTLALGNNRQFIQIASDGGLLPKPVVQTSISVQPAERVDIVVDFRQFGVGSEVILRNTVGEPSTTAVLRFDVVKGGAEEARVPKTLLPMEELPPVNAQRGFPLTFHGLGTAQWQINGQGFDPNRIDARPRQETSELWTFSNFSQRTHPMHLHGYHFQVQSVNGKPPAPGDAAWKDTVAVLPGSTVTIRPYFDYFPGKYVFHCHAAEHGDMSMMGQMQVSR